MPDQELARIGRAYDARAAEYVELLGAVDDAAPEDRALIEAWRGATPGRLLDAGCGPGQWTDLLAAGGRDAVGLDLSAAFLASARARFPSGRYVRADLRALPLADASCDGVLAWYSLIHLPPELVPEALAEIARVLRPGGSVLLGFFDGEPRTPFDHQVTTAWWWSVEAMSDALVVAGLRPRASRRRHGDGHRPHADLLAHR
ncbi:class I SAM-dependent methyltransferase [Aeromicrobium alkaliterrae]|uniref:Class I SAM-dependent methyltransferase n=1 Tax=Aeromicrobium alkaliterrae TaxID=302168 RepID=A0ABN2KAW3_9ACTN